MSESQFFRYQSITGKYGILNVMRHNKRSDDHVYEKNNHIDRSRSHLNYSLLDDRSAEEVARYVRMKHAEHDVLVRANSVMGIEVLFSLPDSWKNKDSTAFFKDCFDWVQTIFPVEMLSFDVHLDEPNPHAHCVFLPLVDGKLQGNKIKGDRSVVNQRQIQFSREVAGKYGLAYKPAKKLSSKEKHLIAAQVRNRLQTDVVVKSIVWSVIRDDINRNPLPYAESLSIPLPANAEKTRNFVDIKRSRGRGEFIK